MWKLLPIFVLCGTAFAQLATMDQIPTARQTSQQGNSDVLSFSSNVVSGNFLVVQYSGGGTFTPTIADTLTSTWTLRVNNVNNGAAHGYVWTAVAPSSGADTVTITESGSTVNVMSIAEFANVAGFDAVATGSSAASSNVVTLPNVTTAQYRDLILDIVIMGPGVSIQGPHDVAYTPDFLAEDTTTTSETAFLQTRLSGNPGTVTGSTVFTSSASGGSLQVTMALTSTASLAVSTPNIPDAVQGQSYSFQMQATGGAGTNVWTTTAGTLPCGLSLASSGVISGTPTCSNANTITFKVTDSGAATATKNLTLHVGTSANTITRVQGAAGISLTGVTSGHIILVGIMNTSAFSSIFAETAQIQDGLGSIYTLVPGATNDLVQLYWGVAASSGNISLTIAPALTSGFSWISEWTNIAPIFDTGVTSKYISTTGSSPISSAAITSPVAEMLYAFSSPGTQTATVTVSAPFSRDINTSGGVNMRQSESDYYTGASSGSNTATWTVTSNASNAFNMTLLGLRPTVTGTAPTSTPRARTQVY